MNNNVISIKKINRNHRNCMMLVCLLMTCCVAVWSTTAHAQQEDKTLLDPMTEPHSTAIDAAASHAKELKIQSGLDALAYTEGQFLVATSFYSDGQWGQPFKARPAVAERFLDGHFIRMKTSIPFSGEIFKLEMILGYDRFNDKYRLIVFDDVNAFADAYSGHMKNGVLVVDNTQTDTAFPDGKGGLHYGQMRVKPHEHGFLMDYFTSNSPEGTFMPYMKLLFKASSDITTGANQ